MDCWALASGLRSAGTRTHCWNRWGMAGWALEQSGCSGSPPVALVDTVRICAHHGGTPVFSALSGVWEKGSPAGALSHWKCLGAWLCSLHPLVMGYTPWAAQCLSHQGPEKEIQESVTLWAPPGWPSHLHFKRNSCESEQAFGRGWHQVWAVFLHYIQGVMCHLGVTRY